PPGGTAGGTPIRNPPSEIRNPQSGVVVKPKDSDILLETAPDYVLGFDVGGTRIKVGAVGPKGKLLEERIIPTGASAGPKRLLETLLWVERAVEKTVGGPPLAV